MKRSKVIRLVLLGGGVAAMLAACGDNREAQRRACEEARAQLRPDAEQICARSTSSRSGYSSSRSYGAVPWFQGRTRSDTTTRSTAPSTSSRSGFGSVGRSFSSGG